MTASLPSIFQMNVLWDFLGAQLRMNIFPSILRQPSNLTGCLKVESEASETNIL